MNHKSLETSQKNKRIYKKKDYSFSCEEKVNIFAKVMKIEKLKLYFSKTKLKILCLNKRKIVLCKKNYTFEKPTLSFYFITAGSFCKH